MPVVDVRLTISDDAFAAMQEHHGAMPVEEFLSYCTELGIYDVRDNYQHQQREFLCQTMNTSMTNHQRCRAQRGETNVTELVLKKKPHDDSSGST